jgi:hypothetical protein
VKNSTSILKTAKVKLVEIEPVPALNLAMLSLILGTPALLYRNELINRKPCVQVSAGGILEIPPGKPWLSNLW